MKNKESQVIKEEVKNYYGNVLQSKSDLKTTSCCSLSDLPTYLRPILSQIHPEIQDKFYGCGSPIPLAMEGKTILDLGCGTGRDVYLLSKLVGENGRVIGVDMTIKQIEIAQKYQDYHKEKFGFAQSNVEFIQGNMEDLSSIASNSIDIVVSNCVINLSTDKLQVLSETFRVLKEGGELYFSDIFADRRIPKKLVNDSVLYGECLSGALYIHDFRRILAKVGCLDYRVLERSIVEPQNQEIENKIGNIKFLSMSIRAFKLSSLEDQCEDYGQVAIYRKEIKNSPNFYVLDDHHIFYLNKPVLVCSNTAEMLQKTRLSAFFEVLGDKKEHFGLFDCDTSFEKENITNPNACC